MGDSQLEVFDWKPAYAMLIRLEVLATWKPQSSHLQLQLTRLEVMMMPAMPQ